MVSLCVRVCARVRACAFVVVLLSVRRTGACETFRQGETQNIVYPSVHTPSHTHTHKHAQTPHIHTHTCSVPHTHTRNRKLKLNCCKPCIQSYYDRVAGTTQKNGKTNTNDSCTSCGEVFKVSVHVVLCFVGFVCLNVCV